MLKKALLTVATALAATGAVPATSLAKGGGHGGGGDSGGGSAPALPSPAIAPGTFDGIGPGPVYIHDSFGWAQTTRLAKDGSIVDVLKNSEIDGIRSEYPNNRTESWSGLDTRGAPSWKLATVSEDPFEPYTALQDSPQGYIDGSLSLVDAELGGVDTRPSALLPFTAPSDSASTVSADIVSFVGKTAIGFSDSGATTRNFETDGQAWLELERAPGVPIAGNAVLPWTFHTSGTTLSGTFTPAASGFNRVAVSYDPVSHVAAATINGTMVASVPYTASPITDVGVEGSLNANVDNFTVRAGTVSDPPPDSVAAPALPAATGL